MIVVLTYDHPHRKTYDVVCRLLAEGHKVSVVATPWKNRKKRDFIYAHRPGESGWPQFDLMCPEELCKGLGLDFHRVSIGADTGIAETIEPLRPRVVVVGGAGILPKSVVTEYAVVNVHPGLLPARRGLDVLKWAVHDCVQVGVTAHICDERTDLGRRLVEEQVNVLRSDTFHSFAMRQYEYELSMLNLAVKMVLEGKMGEEIHPGETRPYRRMPKVVEATLLQRFEDYKRVFA